MARLCEWCLRSTDAVEMRKNEFYFIQLSHQPNTNEKTYAASTVAVYVETVTHFIPVHSINFIIIHSRHEY